jgi:isopentenyl diphosphate isomerase/L-lactate dehydrogenase-like FMN-dependent dehydrogenase
MHKPFVTPDMLEQYRKDQQTAKLQAEILAKAYEREQRKVAEREAAARHKQELRTWASIADHEAHRRHVYWLRADWVGKVIEAGIDMPKAELYELAKVKFPF